MINIRKKCRCCGSPQLSKFLNLGSQPLANSFLKTNENISYELKFPLEVFFCESCNFVQLIHIIDKDVLFRDYVYFSSAMPKVSIHWRNYAEYLIKNYLNPDKDLVVEVGSNDGVLLKFFQSKGFNVLGIDPAINIAKKANENGIPTLPEFFDEQLAKQIHEDSGAAKVIMGNNVFAHVDDLEGFCRGVAALLDRQGVFCVEAPYLIDMFENLTYDTVYHEHVSYLSVRPLIHLFHQFKMEIFDIEIVPSQGQSLRLYVAHAGQYEVQDIVGELVNKELDCGLDKLFKYENLADRIEKSKNNVVRIIEDLKKSGKRIAAYGAPAKGNTLLNYCGLNANLIEFALEDLHSKCGLYTPGTFIPVVPRTYAEANLPDYYLLLAWNYLNPILEKEDAYRNAGGKFIIPVGDEIEII